MKKRIIIFLITAFGLSWGLMAYVQYGPDDYTPRFIARCFMQLTPIIAALFTRLVTAEGMTGLKTFAHLRQDTVKYYVAAWFVPTLLIIGGMVLYFLLFPGDFSIYRSQYVMEDYLGQPNLISNLIFKITVCIFLGPFANFFVALCEEAGWRGYMLPRLRHVCGPRVTLLLSGLIWGLWHAPAIAIGHNYGTDYWGSPWFGIIAMIVISTAMGAFLSLLTVKTDSMLPAVIGHAAFNASAILPVYFKNKDTSPFIGPESTGCVGGVFLILLGVILICEAPRWMGNVWVDSIETKELLDDDIIMMSILKEDEEGKHDRISVKEIPPDTEEVKRGEKL